jgi:hypothetical protein
MLDPSSVPKLYIQVCVKQILAKILGDGGTIRQLVTLSFSAELSV